MNTLERRQIVRGQVIDLMAKTAVVKSRRERADAAKKAQGAGRQPLCQAESRYGLSARLSAGSSMKVPRRWGNRSTQCE